MNQPAPAAFRKEQESQRINREAVLQKALRLRDAEGEFINAVVVKEPRFDDGVQTLLHFGNPYLERPTLGTLPIPLSKDEANEIMRTIILFPEA